MTTDAKPPVKWGDWIGEGWKMFTEQWQGWVKLSLGFFVAIIVPTVAIILVAYIGVLASTLGSASSPRSVPPEASLIPVFLMLAAYGLLMIWIVPATAFVNAGMYRAAFKQLRGGKIEFRDLFSGRDCFLRLLGAGLLEGLLAGIGFLFCIVPAFLVAGLFFFTQPLIVERGLGVTEAMRESFEYTKKNLFMFVLFAIVVGLLAQIGANACYVGLLATYPLRFTIGAVAFRDSFGMTGARSFLTPSPQAAASYAAPQEAPNAAPPQLQQTAPQKLCPNCQGPIPASALFCPRCGRNI